MQKKPFLLQRFFPYMGDRKILLYLALISSGIAAVLNALPFVFIWCMIREILLSDQQFSFQQIRAWTWGIGLSAILGIVFYFVALMSSHLAAFRVEVGLQKVGFRTILVMPLGFFDTVESGKIRKVINDSAGTTHSFLAHQLPDLAGSLITPVIFLIMIVAVNWKLGLVALIPFALGICIFSTMMNAKGREFMNLYYTSLEEMSNEAVEYVRGVPVVKTFGQTVFSFKRFYDSILHYKNYVAQYTLLWKHKMSFFNVVIQSTAFFLIPAAILLLAQGADAALVLTDLLFYLVVAPNFSSMLMKSVYFRQNASIAGQALDRIDKMLDYKALSWLSEESLNPDDAPEFSLTFRDVFFKYPGAEKNAVDGINFTVNPGETVALVGPSGGGKTTLARLAARFWDVDAGQVLIGGREIGTIPQKTLMGSLSFVFQNTRLFNRSIRENIVMGKETATEKEIERAVELSQSRDIVNGLEAGLDTVIGTAGTWLSGGEQQRISLARALLKDAPIVLLDEATAFADPENEQSIFRALQELGRGKTTLMIAHRLSSVKDVDRIVVVAAGKIVEQGSHDQLLEQGGIYARMYAEYEESIAWKLRGQGDGGEL